MGAKRFQALFFCPYFFACFDFNLRVLRALRGATKITFIVGSTFSASCILTPIFCILLSVFRFLLSAFPFGFS
jgi:hypothetical protein